MTCETIQQYLEDLHDGELPVRRADEVRAHLAACSHCQAARVRLEAEAAAFAAFRESMSIEPSGEMWTAIRERIQSEPVPPAALKPRWRSRFGDGLFRVVLRQGAFALLLMTISILGTLYLLRRGGTSGGGKLILSPPPAALNPVGSPVPGLTPAPPVVRVPSTRGRQRSDEEMIRQQIARAEREYQGAVRLLERAIARRRNSLDPTVVREYESSLALIDSSIRQSRAALRANPNDLGTGQFLLAAYARKVELMQDIAMPWE